MGQGLTEDDDDAVRRRLFGPLSWHALKRALHDNRERSLRRRNAVFMRRLLRQLDDEGTLR